MEELKQEIELLKLKVKSLELELELLKLKQPITIITPVPYNPWVEPYNPYPLNPPYPIITWQWTCGTSNNEYALEN